MIAVSFAPRRIRTLAAALVIGLAAAPAAAHAASGFGQLSGPGGCAVSPGAGSPSRGTGGCADGKALRGASAVAVSPDGTNVYVAGGVDGPDVAKSFGAVAVFKRDQATGAISESACLSSDGTDGRDGASGACTAEPSLLGASGVAVSRDGKTVFVSSASSGSVVAFSRDAASGGLTRLGCFQATPRPGAPCAAASLFSGSRGLLVSADGTALYVASPMEGAVSTLASSAKLRTPAGIVAATTATQAGAASATGASGATAAPPSLPISAIFSSSLAGDELLNPCIAVNGLDGVCSVGTATSELDALALSSDGKEVYGAALGSSAIDVFEPQGDGSLTQAGCVMVDPPQGLCSSASRLENPFSLAVSPDGTSVYAAASNTVHPEGERVDVLARNATDGALSQSGCLEYEEPPRPKEEQEEEEEEEGEEGKSARASAADTGCAGAAGLRSVGVVAVSGDSSSVYAIGNGSAAIFSRNPATGQLTEASCADSDDTRCTSFPSLQGVAGAALSPDGRQVYVASSESDAVTVFGVGAAVTSARASATGAGLAHVSVACPAGLRRACNGHVDLTRVLARTARRTRRHADVRRLREGRSSSFSIGPGHHATVAVRLSPAARRLLRRERRLRLLAIVRATSSGGGSGYGRHLSLRLAP